MERTPFPLLSEPVATEVPKLGFLFTTVRIDCISRANRSSRRARGDLIQQVTSIWEVSRYDIIH